MAMTPELMTLRGRMGAYATHAAHDPRETTAKAREAFHKRFERQVDPDGVLATSEPHELARRAEAARKAYMASLAFKSAQARQRKREACGTCGGTGKKTPTAA